LRALNALPKTNKGQAEQQKANRLANTGPSSTQTGQRSANCQSATFALHPLIDQKH
jgi:hypothetical protein